MLLLLLITYILMVKCDLTTNEFHFRVEPGDRTCFYQSANAGHMMEVYYQVVDGQHGDLDISLDITDPAGTEMANDHKKGENAIIKDLTVDGDYAICLDNSFSKFNSKLVFVYVALENEDTEAAVDVVNGDGQEEPEVLTWRFMDENAQPYYVELDEMTETFTSTLKHVVKARHMLAVYSATRSRDSYNAFKETFVVDAWSSFQISLMVIVGVLQVFMIKKLFKSNTYR